MQLQPRTYSFDQGKFPGLNLAEGKQIGFVSQEVQSLFPDFVETTKYVLENGTEVDYLAMNYLEFIPVLTKAIQEQQQLIVGLQQINEELRNRISALEAK